MLFDKLIIDKHIGLISKTQYTINKMPFCNLYCICYTSTVEWMAISSVNTPIKHLNLKEHYSVV